MYIFNIILPQIHVDIFEFGNNLIHNALHFLGGQCALVGGKLEADGFAVEYLGVVAVNHGGALQNAVYFLCPAFCQIGKIEPFNLPKRIFFPCPFGRTIVLTKNRTAPGGEQPRQYERGSFPG